MLGGKEVGRRWRRIVRWGGAVVGLAVVLSRPLVGATTLVGWLSVPLAVVGPALVWRKATLVCVVDRRRLGPPVHRLMRRRRLSRFGGGRWRWRRW